MDSLLPLILGLLAGGAAGWALAQARAAGLAEKAGRAEAAELQVRELLQAKARAEAEGARAGTLEKELEAARAKKEALEVELAERRKEQEAQQEKVAWTEKREQQFREGFQALAAESLKQNAEGFMQRAREQLDGLLKQVRGDWGTHKAEIEKLVEPLEKTLGQLDKQVRELEQKREGAYEGLRQVVNQSIELSRALQQSTTELAQALKSSHASGKWGEITLRRVVEMAGLQKHVDFQEQVTGDAGRPDMVVRLPNGGLLPVDAKAPVQSYLAACRAGDERERSRHVAAHAAAVKGHVRELAKKAYWKDQEGRSPEFVAMFVPNDACLAAAFEHDPDLLEYAMQEKVILTTPVTLLALLKAVAYGWQQHQVTENAREVAESGQELHRRISTFVGHLAQSGRSLGSAVEHYNKAIGSLERMVLPQLRRFKDLGVTSGEMPSPPVLDQAPRELPEKELEG